MNSRMTLAISMRALFIAGCFCMLTATLSAQTDRNADGTDYSVQQIKPPYVEAPKPVDAPAPSADEDDARKYYSGKIRGSYNFRFGANNISTPGNAKSVGDDFVQPGAFPTAKYCSRCHLEAYTQWRQALHSNSFRTPFYRTSVNILMRTKGIEFARHCDSCHNPIGVLGLSKMPAGPWAFLIPDTWP